MLRFLPAITLLLSACNGASAGGGGGGGVAVHAQAESDKAPELQVETLAEGFDHPWDLAFLPDGTMLVTVRSGQLRHVSTDGTVSVPISGVPEVFAENQSGLLDVLLHPNFAENRQLYLSYGSRCAQGGATSAVTRARLTDNNGTLRLAADIFCPTSEQIRVETCFGRRIRIVIAAPGTARGPGAPSRRPGMRRVAARVCGPFDGRARSRYIA